MLFLPAFFAQVMLDYQVVWKLVGGVLAFSFLASAVYIINDLRDKEADQLHPVKQFRPIAAETISTTSAGIAFICCLLASGGLLFFLGGDFWIWLGIYFLLNLGYSFGLKRIPIIEVLIVASGFPIRIYAGGDISAVPISGWLTLMILFGALLMVLGKRRDELIWSQTRNVFARPVLKYYSLKWLDGTIFLLMGCCVVVYLMYCSAPEIRERIQNPYIYFTAVWILLGIFRYLQRVYVEKTSADPMRLFVDDWVLQLIILAWILSFAGLLYV